jgi:hypothetical protein
VTAADGARPAGCGAWKDGKMPWATAAVWRAVADFFGEGCAAALRNGVRGSELGRAAAACGSTGCGCGTAAGCATTAGCEMAGKCTVAGLETVLRARMELPNMELDRASDSIS